MAGKQSYTQVQKTDQKVQEKGEHESSASGVVEPRRFLGKDQLLLVPSLLLLALFAPLAWWAHKHPVDAVDVNITRAFQKNRSPFVHYATTVVTYTGGSPAILRSLAVLVAFGMWKRHLRLEAAMTVGIALTSAALKELLQRVINRPRPSPLLVHVYKKAHGKSFPSGHVIASLSFWGWLVALGTLLIQPKRAWQKVLLGLPTLMLGLIGPTRVYLGDHWTSDVIGGYLVGSAWLCLFLQLYLKLRAKGVLAEEKK